MARRKSWYDFTYPKANGKDWVLKAAVFSALRRLSYRTPMYAEAKRRARIKRGKYRCAGCGKLFGPKQIAVDHIAPVVNITGFKTFDEYIKRLLVSPDKLQVLCNNGKHSCHKRKSRAENKRRREFLRNSK